MNVINWLERQLYYTNEEEELGTTHIILTLALIDILYKELSYIPEKKYKKPPHPFVQRGHKDPDWRAQMHRYDMKDEPRMRIKGTQIDPKEGTEYTVILPYEYVMDDEVCVFMDPAEVEALDGIFQIEPRLRSETPRVLRNRAKRLSLEFNRSKKKNNE